MPKKILVVDDEPDIVEFLTDLLEERGYSVTSANNGAAALERAAQEKPDLVLLDVGMPKQTGTDFYRQFSRRKEFEDIPVIIVSGHPSRRIAVSKRVTIIDKPIEKEKLLGEIDRLLNESLAA